MVDVVVQGYLDSQNFDEKSLLIDLLKVQPVSSSSNENHMKFHIILINRLYDENFSKQIEEWIHLCWEMKPPLILELFEVTAKLKLFNYLMPLLTHENLQIQSDILHVFSKYQPPMENLPFPHPAVLQLLLLYPDIRYLVSIDLGSIPDSSFYLLLPLAKKFGLVEKFRDELLASKRMQPFFIFAIDDDKNSKILIRNILSDEYGVPPFLFYVLLYEHTKSSSYLDDVLSDVLFELIERRKFTTKKILFMILKILKNVCYRMGNPSFPCVLFEFVNDADISEPAVELLAPFHFDVLWNTFETNAELALSCIEKFHQPLPEYVHERVKKTALNESVCTSVRVLALRLVSCPELCINALRTGSEEIKIVALEEILHRFEIDVEIENLLLTLVKDFDHLEIQSLSTKILFKFINVISPSSIVSIRSLFLDSDDPQVNCNILKEIKTLNSIPAELSTIANDDGEITMTQQQHSLNDELKRLLNELNTEIDMDCY